MKILVTGSAGFIGYHLSKELTSLGHEVVGLDNLNHYYDVRLKLDRLANLGIDAYEIAMGKTCTESKTLNYRFFKLDMKQESETFELFKNEKFEVVFNLAAQAGVRYSIDQPQAYVNSNLIGFANLLEACRHFPVKHLVYASSSSVYGNSKTSPFKTTQNVDHPISFYAATKKCNELMAHSYSHLFKIPTTGLRFFTVYGEWGRPDMATMLFAKAILNNDPIKVFNNGDMSRDFTYVGDIVQGLIKVMENPPSKVVNDIQFSEPPYAIYNIGNSKPVRLLDFIQILEKSLNKETKKVMYPMQQGDVKDTYADVTDLINKMGYHPNTPLEEGIKAFADWYVGYYEYESSNYEKV